MTDLLKAKLIRRTVLQTAAVGVIGIDPARRAVVYAAEPNKPKKEAVNWGRVGNVASGAQVGSTSQCQTLTLSLGRLSALGFQSPQSRQFRSSPCLLPLNTSAA